MIKEEIVFLTPEKDYGIFDEYLHVATPDHFWVRWRFEVLRKMIGPSLSGDVLDIGCGNGVVRGMLERAYTCEVCGCDLVASALRKVPAGRGRIYFYDIRQMDRSLEKKFPLLLLLDVLEHVQDPVVFLKAAGFHLAAGGKLIVNVPAGQYLYSSFDRVQGHVKRYSRADLRRELSEAGFEIQRMTYWGMSLWPIVCLRAVMVSFFPQEKAMQVSYPSSPLVDPLLFFLMRLEMLFSWWPFGNAIMAVAVKKDEGGGK